MEQSGRHLGLGEGVSSKDKDLELSVSRWYLKS